MLPKLWKGLFGLVLVSELWLIFFLTPFQPIESFNRALIDRPEPQEYPPFSAGSVKVTISWSAGNKSYCYLKCRSGDSDLLNFWATQSLSSRPQAWIRRCPAEGPPEFVTYQPWVLDNDTPLGSAEAGFYFWRKRGERYERSVIPVFPLNLWLRSPFPFQD